MRSILLTVCLLGCILGHAQPVLNAANSNPVAGDTFSIHVCDTNSAYAGIAVTGAGVTWDYSSLKPDSMSFPYYLISLNFADCSSTPYCDSFPGSNVASIGVEYSVSGTIDSQDNYFKTSSSGCTQVGIVYDGSITYDTPGYELLSFPFTYLSQNTNDFDTKFNGYITGTVKDTIYADGYGTLKLPTGSYNNVLRVHYMSLNSGAPEEEESYFWYEPGFHYPLLEVHLFGNNIVNVQYITGTFADEGVSTIATTQSISVYPNPSTDELHVSYTATVEQAITLSLMDAQGKQVMGIINNNPIQGANEAVLKLSSLPVGIYLLQVQSGSDVISKKVSVIH